MKRNKTVGIIFLVIFGMAVFGGIINGSFSRLGDRNLPFLIGFFTPLIIFLWIGLHNVIPAPGSMSKAEEEYLKKQQLKKEEEEKAAAEAKKAAEEAAEAAKSAEAKENAE